MPRSNLEIRLHELRSVDRQARSAVTCGSLEQRARYKELRTEFDALEQEVEESAPVEELLERCARLLEIFRRFQHHIEPGASAAL
jgi:hypothetical protein